MGYSGTILFPGHHTGNAMQLLVWKFTYLTPWGTVLEKLVVVQVVKFRAFHRTPRFFTVFTRARYWNLSSCFLKIILILPSRLCSVGTVTRVRFPVEAGIICLCRYVQTVLRPTQPPIQWVPGVRWPGREAHHSTSSTAEVKNRWGLYLHSPIRLHGVVFN
jgi:hypothetical protein